MGYMSSKSSYNAKLKPPGYHERDVQLIKKVDLHATFAHNTTANTVTTFTNKTLTLRLFLPLPQ